MKRICKVSASNEASAKMVSLLVAHGADVNARGWSTETGVDATPLSEAIYYDTKHYAAQHILPILLYSGASLPEFLTRTVNGTGHTGLCDPYR